MNIRLENERSRFEKQATKSDGQTSGSFAVRVGGDLSKPLSLRKQEFQRRSRTEMNNLNERSTLGQIINWFFDCAAEGTHSSSGLPKSHEYLCNNRSLVDHHIPGVDRRKMFIDVDLIEMQALIDATVSYGSETAAFSLRNFLGDLDKFAMFKGILEKRRTRKLLAPVVTRRDRALKDVEFANAWATLVRNADGVGLPVRLSCLAVLVSTITLQPLAEVLKLRSEWIVEGGDMWVVPETSHHVYIPASARLFIEMAEEVGDLAHREMMTPFVFPSAGSQSSPNRNLSLSQLLDACADLLGRDIKPQDLRHTGLNGLRSHESVPPELIERITTFCPIRPDIAHVALAEAWSERVAEIQKQNAANRWR